jgi:hypothetical protein
MVFIRLHKPKRRASTYIMVVASSMMVTIIGLASMFAVRVQRRSAEMTKDCAEARLCAESAVELGLLFVKDQNWRSTWPNGTWLSDQQLGSGSFTLAGIDPRDSDLADSRLEPLVLTGTGAKGLARHKTQLVLVPVIKPLEALNTCLHASGLIHVRGGRRITAFGAPISTNGNLDNEGTIAGDAEALVVVRAGIITGTLTVPAPGKNMPDSQLISDYISKATVVPFTDMIDNRVLAPSYNPWGPTNPDGVYFIDTGNNDLTIKNSRIHGTLIVRTAGKTLKLEEAVLMENYRSDYPVLIVDGKAEIKYKSAEKTLSETARATNYNPPWAPYEGQWDFDQFDEYPNEIRGLVHVRGELKLLETARIRGAVICEGMVTCDGANNPITHDARLYASPPEGYTYVAGMKISPGSYKQVVE